MKYFFLIAGLCGIPFTAGWSLALGIIGFFFVIAGERVYDTSIEAIQDSSNPVSTGYHGCMGVGMVLALGVLAIGLMLAVGMVMVGGGR